MPQWWVSPLFSCHLSLQCYLYFFAYHRHHYLFVHHNVIYFSMMLRYFLVQAYVLIIWITWYLRWEYTPFLSLPSLPFLSLYRFLPVSLTVAAVLVLLSYELMTMWLSCVLHRLTIFTPPPPSDPRDNLTPQSNYINIIRRNYSGEEKSKVWKFYQGWS